ncbi:hypothetical protein BRADI_1g01305v3 [Brachypodium distachyon]|uniref:Uncharacterized protein n=1 Tax=Brachypodium distachyon TaxID=15368 RepID=A0A2K2DHL5_BRADI|nr:hypothetical protein BRADI_1g01305v3 [Brachypodium distachyon]
MPGSLLKQEQQKTSKRYGTVYMLNQEKTSSGDQCIEIT